MINSLVAVLQLILIVISIALLLHISITDEVGRYNYVLLLIDLCLLWMILI